LNIISDMSFFAPENTPICLISDHLTLPVTIFSSLASVHFQCRF
jgi:hypothetical protein